MAITVQSKEELTAESTSTPDTPVSVTDVAWPAVSMAVSTRYLVLYRAQVKVTGTGKAKVRVEYVSATTAQPPAQMTVLGGTCQSYFWWDVFDTDPVTIREVRFYYELSGTGTVEVDQCQSLLLTLDTTDEDDEYVVSKSNVSRSYTGPGYEVAQDCFLPAGDKWLVFFRQRFTGAASGDTIISRLHQERTSDAGAPANWLSCEHYYNDTAEEHVFSGMVTIDAGSVPLTLQNQWNDTSGSPSAELKENAIFALSLDGASRKQDHGTQPSLQIANTTGTDFPSVISDRSLFFETGSGADGVFLGNYVIHPNESGWTWKTQVTIEDTASPTDQTWANLNALGPIISNVEEEFVDHAIYHAATPVDGTQQYEIQAGGDTVSSPADGTVRIVKEQAVSIVRMDFGSGTGVTVQSFPQNGGGYSTTGNLGPPVWTVPGSQGCTESLTLTLQASSSNAITITEPDGATMACTLTVTDGTVALGAPGSVSNVTGDSSASITWDGTPANTITALEGSVFTPPVGHNVGDTYTLTVTADDEHPSDPQQGNAGFTIFIQAAPPAGPDPQNVQSAVNPLDNDIFAGGKFVR